MRTKGRPLCPQKPTRRGGPATSQKGQKRNYAVFPGSANVPTELYSLSGDRRRQPGRRWTHWASIDTMVGSILAVHSIYLLASRVATQRSAPPSDGALCGPGVGGVKRALSARKIVEELVAEAEDLLRRPH